MHQTLAVRRCRQLLHDPAYQVLAESLGEHLISYPLTLYMSYLCSHTYIACMCRQLLHDPAYQVLAESLGEHLISYPLTLYMSYLCSHTYIACMCRQLLHDPAYQVLAESLAHHQAKRSAWRTSRLRLAAELCAQRCSTQRPLYGRNLLHMLTFANVSTSALMPGAAKITDYDYSSKAGVVGVAGVGEGGFFGDVAAAHAAAAAAAAGGGLYGSGTPSAYPLLPSILEELAPTYTSRAAAFEDLLREFMFVIPRARAPPPDVWCCQPDAEQVGGWPGHMIILNLRA